MDNIYLEKLEFNRIKLSISDYAITVAGKNHCMDIVPETNKNKVEKMLAETTEAVSMIYRKGNPPLNELMHIEEHILALKNQNFLSIKSLLEITKLLIVSREVKDYYFKDTLNQSEVLTRYFDNLYTNIRHRKNNIEIYS